MPEPQPYLDVDSSDRFAVRRLELAAKKGDQRAQATLDRITQQNYAAAWHDAEQKRIEKAEADAERRRNRPMSVLAARHRLKVAREAKEAERQARADAAADQ